MLNLNDKKVLILGASGSIGEQTAITLSNIGAKVVLSGRKKEKLQEILEKLPGDGHVIFDFDLEKTDKIKEYISSVVEYDQQKLYGLVYCTGLMPVRPIKNTTHDFLHNTMLINYFAFAEAVRCFSHKNICEGGSVVAISSYASQNGDKGQLAYSASKGAIDSSVVVMAKELFIRNIRVNSIRPAVVYSNKDFNIEAFSSREQEIYQDMQIGFIEPQNIAEQVAFLLSECSSGVTGRCFDVRGYLS